MLRKKYDLFFIFSIIFIAVFGLFLLNDYLNKNNLSLYLDTIKNKIAEMIPDEDRAEFDKMYSAFIIDVDEKKVAPEQLRDLAQKVINLRQEKENLTTDEIREILPIPEITDKVGRIPVIPANPLKGVEWKELAENFKKSYERGDTIRILNLRHLKLKEELELKLQEFSKVSHKIKINHEELAKKVEQIKKNAFKEDYSKGLKQELNSAITDNEQINKNIIALEEIEKTIKNEKKKLLEELKKIELNQPL